jgi:hypothetical protein
MLLSHQLPHSNLKLTSMFYNKRTGTHAVSNSQAASAPSPLTVAGAERPPAVPLCKLHDGPPYGGIPRPCNVQDRHGLWESVEGLPEGYVHRARNVTEALPAASRAAS